MPRLPGIGSRISQQLQSLGYSKRGRPDVARFCGDRGYRPQYVYAWLAGRTPSYENLKRLAQDLAVSTSWLAVGEEVQAAAAQEVGLRSRPVGRTRAHPERRGQVAPARSRVSPTLQVLDFGRLREVTTKLVRLEAQLAAIFEAFPDLYIWVDVAGEILDWKGGRAAVPDVLLGPCVGRRIDEVFADDTGGRLRHAVTLAMLTGSPGTVEYTAPVDGVIRTFEARLMPLDPAGSPRPNVLIVVRDITLRVYAERAVRESEARYRALVEGSIEGICINQDGMIRFANQALCDIFGYPDPAALLGRPRSLLFAAAEHERLERYCQARLRGEPAPKRYEFQGQRRDGTLIRLENVVSVVSWDGRPAVLSTLGDITDRERAQEAAAALAESGRKMAATLDPNQVVQHMLESAMRLLHVGRAALYTLDPRTGTLRCLAASGESEPEARVGRELPPGHGLLGLAVASGRPLATSDILSDPAIPQPDWAVELNRTHGLTAVLGVPLTARGQVLGGLAVGDARGRVYTDEEQALLAAFADHAAVALDNARRHRELEERLAALDARQG